MEKTALTPLPTPLEQPSRSFRQKLAFKMGIGVWRSDQQFEGYLFLLPSLIGFLVFVLAPILMSLGLSFHEWDLLTPPEFIGVTNYIELFTRDPIFGSVLRNTFWYMILIVPVQLAVGFLLALALNSGIRALKWYRLLYFMPYIASIVAVAMVFRFLFNQQNGIVSAWIWQLKEALLGLGLVQSSPQLLESVQSIKPPDFLNAPGWAIISVAVFTVWKNVGFTMVYYLAALQAVPETLYDAVQVDGANRWQRLRYVTIPMVSPTTFFLFVVQMIGAFQLFTEPFVMVASTQNSVSLASESLVMYIYRNGFDFQRMGKAAALSWVLFVIVFAVTILQTIFQRRWVHYETE